MARLAIAPQTAIAGYPTLPVTATSADLVFTNPGVAADGISFPHTGREILVVRNTNAGVQTVTITSAPDAAGRTGDITTYSLAAVTGIAVFGPFPLPGWRQTDGNLYAVGSHINVQFAIVRLPSIA